MVRERRKTDKEEENREQEDGEHEGQKVQPRQRSVSKRNMQSLLIELVGGALTLGAYSQTFVSPGKSIGVGLFVLLFGLLVSEGFISL